MACAAAVCRSGCVIDGQAACSALVRRKLRSRARCPCWVARDSLLELLQRHHGLALPARSTGDVQHHAIHQFVSHGLHERLGRQVIGDRGVPHAVQACVNKAVTVANIWDCMQLAGRCQPRRCRAL